MVKNYYASKFGVTVAQLNPKEIIALDNLSKKYSYEELIKAIDNLSSRPKPSQLENAITEILNKQEEIPRKEEKIEQKPRHYTFNDIPDNYKEIFIEYNIPTDIIDFNTLSTLNRTMKSFYLSDVIAEYLYSNLSKEKLAEYTKIADKHFSKMKLTEREKPEAYKIYIKSLIKKELGIYV